MSVNFLSLRSETKWRLNSVKFVIKILTLFSAVSDASLTSLEKPKCPTSTAEDLETVARCPLHCGVVNSVDGVDRTDANNGRHQVSML
jgi:hypothetical protein